MNQLRPELDNVLQCLSLNGYSVLSLIDDIHARCNLNREDERIKTLREGMERDAADICARLLCRITSGPATVLKIGNVQCTCSSSSVGSHATITDFARIVKIYRHVVPIDILPDDVLLEIFDLCLCDPSGLPASNWQTLVHVCQRWRRIVFASPRRLDLHLTCSSGTPVKTNLPFWPVTLPLIVDYDLSSFRYDSSDEDNIVAVLGHPSRVHRITIRGGAPLIEKVITTMRESFPVLTHLDLGYDYRLWSPVPFPDIPRGFLGKSAVRLQHFRLCYISFPNLPMFLLSTRNLVTLKLKEIPPNGHISPEALVGGLAVLTRLTTLSISFCDKVEEISPFGEFKSHLDPLARAVLPALTNFHYEGRSEYLEDFLVRIDTPLLDNVRVEYVFPGDQLEIPQFSRFIERTENLKLDQFTRAEGVFFSKNSYFKFDCPQEKSSLSLNMFQAGCPMQVATMAHVLGQLAAMFSNVGDLFAHGDYRVWSGVLGVTEWQIFFRLFPAVETLRLCGEAASCISSALEDTAEDVFTDVLPALRVIRFVMVEYGYSWENQDFWNELVVSMDRFLALRQQNSGRPVTVIYLGDEPVAEEVGDENPFCLDPSIYSRNF